MSKNISTEHPTEPSTKDFKKLLTSTISDEEFNERSILEEAQLRDPEEDPQAQEEVRNLLLKTFGDPFLQDKAVDFTLTPHATMGEDFMMESQKGGLVDTDSDDFDDFEERLQNSIPGRYDIDASLGQGGFGQVFSVKDNNLKRSIAVKFMHPNSKEKRIKQFIQEARTTARLSHPNILPVYDLDYTDGAMPFFSMRKANGLDLEECIDNKAAAIDTFVKRVNIIIKICDAVAYAHNKGVIHNDIKPGNIIVGEFGDIMLVDWGTSTPADLKEEGTQPLRGTPMYMAPEQARKEGSDELTDIYAIGSTLFHLLTNRFPYQATENLERFWLEKKTGKFKTPNAQERNAIPPALLAICEKAMAAEREERYLSVEALRIDLLNFRNGEPVSCYRDSLLKQAHRIFIKNKNVFYTILLFLCLSAAAAYMLYLEKAKETSEWSLAYTETFDGDQASLNDHWKSLILDETQIKEIPLDDQGSSHWYILNGALYTRPSKQPGTYNLSSKLTTTENSKLTWSVSSVDKNYDFIAFIGGDHKRNAYTVHIGHQHNNRLVTLHKNNKQISSAILPQGIELGTSYTFTLSKIDEYVRLFMDERLILDYLDPLPLNGGAETFFGFESRNNIVKIDNVKVWRQPLAEKILPIAVADDFYNRNHFEHALMTYDDLRKNYSQSSIAPLALYRSALCLKNKASHQNQANNLFHQFVKKYNTHPYVLNAHIELCEQAVFNKDTAYINKCITLGQQHRQHQNIGELFNLIASFYRSSNNVNTANTMGSKQNNLDAIQAIQLLGKSLGIPAQHYLMAQALEPCAQVLLQLGYYDELLQLCPYTEAAAESLRLSGKIDQLAQTHKHSLAYAKALLYAGQYTKLYQTFGKQAHILNTILVNTDDIEAFAQVVPIDSPYQYNLGKLKEQSKQENDGIKPNALDGHLKLHSIQTINALANKDQALARKSIENMLHFQQDYKQHVLSAYILPAFADWLQHKDKDKLDKQWRLFINDVDKRYDGMLTLQLKRLGNTITLSDLQAHPSHQYRSSDELDINLLIDALCLELSGNTEQAIKQYDFNFTSYNADLRAFATWRRKELSK